MTMKTLKAVCAGIILSTSGLANAALITFDDLGAVYGDGSTLLANMNEADTFISYESDGFLITLNAPNFSASTYGAHIGDAASSSQTFDWHSAGYNGSGSYVTLTMVDGGLFDLTDFSYNVENTLTVTANGYSAALLSSSGTETVNYTNVSSVSFTTSSGSADYSIDNINVSAAIPEPTTLAILP